MLLALAGLYLLLVRAGLHVSISISLAVVAIPANLEALSFQALMETDAKPHKPSTLLTPREMSRTRVASSQSSASVEVR